MPKIDKESSRAAHDWFLRRFDLHMARLLIETWTNETLRRIDAVDAAEPGIDNVGDID